MAERVLAGPGVIHGFWQADGQLRFGDRHDPVGRAVDHGDRRTPIALPADQPVADPIGHGELRLPARLQVLDDRLESLRRRQVVEPARVDQDVRRGLADVGLGQLAIRRGRGRSARVARADHLDDRQPEPGCEREVTLVVGGNGHDRAGPVAGQHVVRDPDRDAGAVDRVDRVRAQWDARLLAIGRETLDLRLVARTGDVRLHLRAPVGRGELRDQRMLRCEDHERRPEERVGPCREHAQLVAARLMVVRRGREDNLGTFGPADPVRLHDPDRLGPVDAGEVQQLVRVLGDAQVPLGEVALLDLRAAAPAVPVRAFHLLAGQRPVVRAPVHRRGLPVRQPRLEEAQEQPLVPAVVRRVAGDDLGVPVERGAHGPQLAAHGLDVPVGPRCGVDLVLDRRVLRR